jgi:hypothetical protein
VRFWRYRIRRDGARGFHRIRREVLVGSAESVADGDRSAVTLSIVAASLLRFALCFQAMAGLGVDRCEVLERVAATLRERNDVIRLVRARSAADVADRVVAIQDVAGALLLPAA